MLKIVRTTAENPDFVKLVGLLDAELSEIDGEDNAFYSQYNKLTAIKHTVVAYYNQAPICCGGIKQYDTDTMEIKRMFTLASHRGKGTATQVLKALIAWTEELGYSRCILETGLRNPDAIRLYEKNGFHLMPNYGQYKGVANSRCFEKLI